MIKLITYARNVCLRSNKSPQSLLEGTPSSSTMMVAASAKFFYTFTAQKIVSNNNIRILVYTVLDIQTSVVKGAVNGKYTLDEDSKNAILQICWNAVRS